MQENHVEHKTSPWTRIRLTTVAEEVHFDNERMYVRLTDGREIGVPLVWFPRLLDATPEQRNHWKLISKGQGLHWEEIDEDISIKGLLGPYE